MSNGGLAYDIWDAGLAGRKFTIEGVLDDWEGFRVLVREEESDRMARLAFLGRVAYQVRDESDLEGEKVRSTGLGRGSFYIVRNSEFSARFLADTVRSFANLTHYAICSDTDCVDILTDEAPEVAYL